MNIFSFSIRAFVFSVALLTGTTAVIASRFVITTVAAFTETSAEPESVTMPESERATVFEDLRNEEPIAPEDFDPTGTYGLDTDKLPAAFADFEFIDIATREYEEDNGTYFSRPIIPTGSLQTKKTFELKKIAYGNREISFETTVQDGISYRFVGHFPVSTEFISCEGCEYPADLKGQLKKLKNGKVIAEIEAEFYVHGC
jgi:hypothetical protein